MENRLVGNTSIVMLSQLSLRCLLFLLIVITGFYIQSQSLIGIDMSWLLNAAKRMLKGGNYWSDFFEINPPMAIYLHLPPVIVASYLKVSVLTVFRYYVFSIVFLSLSICSHLLRQIIRDERVYSVLFIAISAAYILLPGYHFGQREHIATMLVLPYLLLAVQRASLQPVNETLSLLVGVMAAIGFSIKPHFLFAYGFVELYIVYRQRNWAMLMRSECLVIISVILIYIASLFYFTPDYFRLLPYIRDFFALFFWSADSWGEMLLQPKLEYYIMMAAVFWVMQGSLIHRDLGVILFLSATGFFVTYLAEPLYLPYHTLPMFTLSVLFVLLVFAETLWQRKPDIAYSDTKRIFTLCFFLLMGMYIPAKTIFYNTQILFQQKHSAREQALIQFTRQSAQGKNIMVFSTDALNTYPLVDYAGVASASRFESLWLLLNIVHLNNLHTSEALLKSEQQSRFLINAVTEDMEKGKPAYVFIDGVVGWGLYDTVPMNYIQFFSQSQRFRNLWKHYRYVTQMDDMRIYERKE